MVSLTLMARLLEAVRPEARLILVGDADQLSSVEAGAVLADIAEHRSLLIFACRQRLAELPGVGDALVPGSTTEQEAARGVVRLRHTWRYGGAIDEFARAVRAADAEPPIAVLKLG